MREVIGAEHEYRRWTIKVFYRNLLCFKHIAINYTVLLIVHDDDTLFTVLLRQTVHIDDKKYQVIQNSKCSVLLLPLNWTSITLWKDGEVNKSTVLVILRQMLHLPIGRIPINKC